MPRFFISTAPVDGSVSITGEDARHIARSLRMAVGDRLTVSDGEGKDYLCSLTKIRDEECLLSVISVTDGEGEPPFPITLFMAYPKGDKLETVIQKAVELGATEIVPFESSRCIKRPSPEKQDKQNLRLSRIAEEAAKQCGRSRIPRVSLPLSFGEAMSLAAKSEISLFCYENEHTKTLKDALGTTAPSSISVTVGPEGGFSPDEAEYAASLGMTPVSLGKRILRCETAPSYALSAISYAFEI